MGALFNNLNINLTKYRMRYLSRRNRAWKYVCVCKCVCWACSIIVNNYSVAEVVLIAMVTTVVVFCAATLLGSCRHESHLSQKQMYCPEIVVRDKQLMDTYSPQFSSVSLSFSLHSRVMLLSEMKPETIFVLAMESSLRRTSTTITIWPLSCSTLKK